MLSSQELRALQAVERLHIELTEQCTCTPLSDRPCAGLLAGGLCDDLHMGRELDDPDDDDEAEPDDL